MFQVLEGSGIGQVGCVVTRYFGGTKLGSGDLARSWLAERHIPIHGADYHAHGVTLQVGWPAGEDSAHLDELASRLKGRLSVTA